MPCFRLSLAAVLVLAAAAPAAAQQDPYAGPYGTQQGRPGTAQQSSEFRDRASEQAAIEGQRHIRRHPGTLTKLGTGTTPPEVQFDVDRREAQQREAQQRAGRNR